MQQEKANMKKLNMLFIVLVSTMALAAANYVSIQGSDTELGPTQAQADNAANAGALAQLNGSCMGPIVGRQKTSDSCSNVGTSNLPTYSCTVTYVAQCQQGQ
jgi:hypothetical protein